MNSRAVASTLILAFAAPFAFAASEGRSPPAPVPLKAGELQNPALVPPTLEVPLAAEGVLPGRLAPGDSRYAVEKAGPYFDTDGDGKLDGRAAPGKVSILRFGKAGAKRAVLVFQRLGRWFAGPAVVQEGKLGKEIVQVLEGRGDGGPPADGDWIRVGEGTAFRPIAIGDLHWSEGRLVRLAFRAEGDKVFLDASPLPAPEWANVLQTGALNRINLWRRGSGLPPQVLDKERSEGCRLHAEYMALHGVGHVEEKDKPGYTAEGAKAGMLSSVGGVPDPSDLVARITSTVLHRVTCIGSRREPLGIGEGLGMSVIRGGGRVTEDTALPCLVPGPGQERVPVLCGSELPRPDIDSAFYEKERGYPVAVSCDGVFPGVRGTKLQIFAGNVEKPEEGYLFTPEAPYSKSNATLATNYGMTMFVAARPLLKATVYVARFTGETDGGKVNIEWAFRTE